MLAATGEVERPSRTNCVAIRAQSLSEGRGSNEHHDEDHELPLAGDCPTNPMRHSCRHDLFYFLAIGAIAAWMSLCWRKADVDRWRRPCPLCATSGRVRTSVLTAQSMIASSSIPSTVTCILTFYADF